MAKTSGLVSGLTQLVGVLALVAALVFGATLVPGAIGDAVSDAMSKINPFDENVDDNTGPALRTRIMDLKEYHAANAYYEVVVELDKGRDWVPDVLVGDSILYIGKGEVDAVVDFSQLDERRIQISEEEKSVTVQLMTPTLSKPTLDIEASRVYSRDRGLITKFQNSELEREAQLRAIEQIKAAAGEEDELITRAKENTTAMLESLFGSVGYTDVTVTFTE
jgi:hypothetical protein